MVAIYVKDATSTWIDGRINFQWGNVYIVDQDISAKGYERDEIVEDKSIELYDISHDIIFRFKNSKTGEIALDKYSMNDLGYSEVSGTGPLYATPKKLDLEWTDDYYYHVDLPHRFFSVGEGQIVSSKHGEHWALEIGWLKEDGYSGDLSGYNFFSTEGTVKNSIWAKHAPSGLKLSSLKFDENIPNGSTIATLSSRDKDTNEGHSYSLVSGDGGENNDDFLVNGDKLVIIESPDYEEKSSYSIRLKTEDNEGLALTKTFTLKVNNIEEYKDSDGNGLVDNSNWIEIYKDDKELISITAKPGGGRIREGRSGTGLKAISKGNNYLVLIQGLNTKKGKFQVLNTDANGLINSRVWVTSEQAMWKGYEEIFDIDLNLDSVVGIHFKDSDNNGLVDDSSSLRLIAQNNTIAIVKGSKRRPQKNRKSWDAIKAIKTEIGYDAIVRGIDKNSFTRYRICGIDSSGLIVNQSRWMTPEDAMWRGYEEAFGIDLNQDNVTGIFFEDLDKNGIIDNSTHLRLMSQGIVVDVAKNNKQNVPAKSKSWAAVRAIETDTGYQVLIKQTNGIFDGNFKVWSLDLDGYVQEQTMWGSESMLAQKGYASLLETLQDI